MEYKEVLVYSNVKVQDDIYVLSLEIDDDVRAGQFYMLKAWEDEPILARPISVHSSENGIVKFAYQVKGRGTKILSSLKAEDKVYVLGPVGNGLYTEKFKGKIALISGGIGIAPMLQIAKGLDGEVDLYAGFNKSPYLIDEFKKYCNNIYIASEKDTGYYNGFITEIFNPFEYNAVICCGPEAMMKRVVDMCKTYATPVYVLMENKMACGVGACLGCTCNTKEGKKRVCVDGPVFKGTDVVFSA
ncbi:MAG: dihydroorotate dehydrogenase electron transfer subunit [Caloramator sp.]|jgi:dihydroorotate dehydrogenase electron transfer subunit|uniref:dihydroorotate dehydrogenase electron transfer subunit n=1 Tax=Caloramator sp. TaxID=1871330 RepID=UPI001D3BBE3D|nr:dihydroorotate dehydrogenase electron transfer subunit [Caloramator sp.]MBZ4662928.1 dihydroorotate dehydrogenase electron transfer subunit [Caloramator sp.]